MKFKKAWGSHFPLLIKLVSQTNGPILELGGGLYSTPFLHWSCFPKKRELVTYDNDKSYFNIIKEYDCDFHKVIFTEDWDKISIERPWDIALIDHNPEERRRFDVARLANYAKFIIIHDSDIKLKNHYNYEKIYPLFKYVYKYRAVKPHTSILSNFVDVTKFEI